jgi:hypothetical protein
MLACFLTVLPGVAPAAVLDSIQLQPETSRAFDLYVAAIEREVNSDNFSQRLFWVKDPAALADVRAGKIRITRQALAASNQIDVPGGQIHDWAGAMFLPGRTIAQVKAVRQDYANYKRIYAPDVVQSRARVGPGEDADVILQLRQKHVISVLLNACFHTGYELAKPNAMRIYSRSVRITEADTPDPCAANTQAGSDRGFLWRLDSYWRLYEADNGVYVECRAISLSRDIPGGLRWMRRILTRFIESFPQESLTNMLNSTRRAVSGGGPG